MARCIGDGVLLCTLVASYAVVGQNPIKWDQPPVPGSPTNIFYGWNQLSIEGMPPIAADDWVCTTTNPVTRIKWWGSFLNWNQPGPPPLPQAFLIRFWTDVPKGADPLFPGFSHPGGQVGVPIYCTNYTWSFAGWDFDPRQNRHEACFQFDQGLNPSEWFYQHPGANGTNIYWLSIEAVTPTGTEFPWGWKTRPRTNSPAPDAAVIFDPIAPFYQPLFYPTTNDWWDLAFELSSQYVGSDAKWYQPPDLRVPPDGIPLGMDVNATYIPGMLQPGMTNLLADDFLCTQPGQLTNITIWGSWFMDQFPVNPPTNVTFTLSIHQDFPMPNPYGYSMPGRALWWRTFSPLQFQCTQVSTNLPEGWFSPPGQYQPVGDFTCFRYDFTIPTALAFYQQGTPTQPIIYWLDVQAQVPGTGQFLFGWKTSVTNWNDDATHAFAREPFDGPMGMPPMPWNRLFYPPGHPFYPESFGMAFRLNYRGFDVNETKWSQPPVPITYADPGYNYYNGWNERSVEGASPIVADDWACTNAQPVTDIHWWGSFLNWSEGMPPQIPDGFRITLWADSPADPTQPMSYSHPSNMVWAIYCTNFTWSFAGWDLDPRNPYAAPEACFKFEQLLNPNEWFYQERGSGTNIYWISIVGVYASGQIPAYPFGWKTRPRDPASLAPDDAVRFEPYMVPAWYEPIYWPYPTNSWDMAFALTTQVSVTPTNDFGDAPDNPLVVGYPTLLINNGARHTIVPGVFLGNLIDAELNGQPNATATGDDLAGLADEDGVVFVTNPLVPGQRATVQVTASVAGYLNAWVDFNANTSWANAGEQVFGNQPLNAGLNTLTFPVPPTAVGGANTFARFRYTTNMMAVPAYTGLASNGEVEDYMIGIARPPPPPPPPPVETNAAKFIQWPDPNGLDVLATTPIVLADDYVCTNTGPVTDIHVWCSWLGDYWSTNVSFWLGIWSDVPGSGTLFPSHPGTLLWSNWFGPGQFGQYFTGTANELFYDPSTTNFLGADQQMHYYTFYPTNPFLQHGTAAKPITYWLSVQASLPTGELYGWKTSTNHWNDDAVYGVAPDGTGPWQWTELRDPRYGDSLDLAFKITVTTNLPPLDFGDAPSPFPTLLANDGARHVIVTGVKLGTQIDGEWDGQPNATATGDDNNPPAGPDDEDGVVLSGTLMVPGDWATVYVAATTNGYLSAWVDFTADGSWATPGDQIFTNLALPTGTNTLYFYVPTNALQGSNVFARFRFSTRQITNFTGLCLDGEVEDYMWPVSEVDYGDAPDLPFPTRHARNGPRHWRAPNFQLGVLPTSWDAEIDGQPNAFATGDDLAGLPDEDGVSLLTPMVPGLPATILVIPSAANGFFSGWIDFNADGSWDTPGDQIFSGYLLNAAGPTNLTFIVPPTAAVGTNVFARFRFSTMRNAILIYTNLVGPPCMTPNGEVEDYQWHMADLDFGDAPDPAYPTLLARNGARHVVTNLFLGAWVDGEPNGRPGPNASGDPDDDGVVFNTALIAGVPATVTVTCSGAGVLQGWIDFNRNGSWADPGEQIIVNGVVGLGANSFNFPVPNNLPNGKTFARFRLSSMPGLPDTGFAPDGEVEDYTVTLYSLKWLQGPDQSNQGVDVDNRVSLADDFRCAESGPITDVHIWGSFEGDVLPPLGPGGMTIIVTIYQDVPVGPGNPNSHPGPVLWTRMFPPGSYQAARNFQMNEWYHNPAAVPPVWIQNADANMFQYDFYIDPTNAFRQVEGLTYWLGVDYLWQQGVGYYFGWKTSWTNWNDDACWLDTSVVPNVWRPLIYGDGHPRLGQSMDLAFALSGLPQAVDLDFADAPAPYPTLIANNGARHFAVPGFLLGALEDTEADGQPHPQAKGDDLNNLADEDGVQFVGPVMVNTQACVNVTLTAPAGYTGLLDAWLDFNGNGAWETSANEQILTNTALVPGVNNLCFQVPVSAKLGTNFARFRLSSAGGLSPTGLAQDGEVEDQRVVIVQPRPSTNIVITNIVVITNRVVGLAWTYDSGIRYQPQWAPNCGTNTDTTGTNLILGGIVWSNCGPEVIGPNHWYWETNTVLTQRIYRVLAPYTWP